MNELLPCPFCGGLAIIRYDDGRCEVGCFDWNCPVQPSTLLTEDISKAKGEWNNRPGHEASV